VCFSAGMYATTSFPFESLTLAIFLCAELGFFGVVTVTLRHTHLLNGAGICTCLLFFNVLVAYCNAGALDFLVFFFLHFFTSWFVVGMGIVFLKKI